jgi:hypothetical protein
LLQNRQAVTSLDVRTVDILIPKRLTAMLCIALALIFAGFSVSSAIDGIQHAPGAPTEHEHLILSDLSMEQDHADDHHAPASDEDSPADHLPGGHHHHGDSGSGTILPAPAGAMMLVLANDPRDIEPEHQAPGLKVRGPERPPKTLTMNA